MLPSQQYEHSGLEALPEAELYRRRETVFLVLSGIFLGTLAMLNLLGITRFLDLGFEIAGNPVMIAVGVLPYPITFLCTDLISELYGQDRASRVVWVGLLLNIWVMFIMWAGGALPGVDLGADREPPVHLFTELQSATQAAVLASMIAYLLAQLVDVHVFHFWKRLTKGKHLWLRNNGSTLASQLVDTLAVVFVTHYLAGGLPVDGDKPLVPQLLVFVLAGYSFKLVVALLDTPFFYLGTRWLCRYLRVPPPEESELETNAERVD